MQINVIRGAAATGKTRRLLQILDEVGLDESALIHGERTTRAALARSIGVRALEGDTVICIDDCHEHHLEWLSGTSCLPEGVQIYVATAGTGPLQEFSVHDQPLVALRDAISELDCANACVLAAKRLLLDEEQAFEAKRRALGGIWRQAVKAAKGLGGEVPGAFREGGLFLTLENGEVSVECLPEGASVWVLTDLAAKARAQAAE
jgi:hypothetical protein